METEPTGFPRPSWIEWLCLPAGVYLALHYAWLLDDGYVYFKYVDNLLFLGHGLVYNPGESVEGISSPGWTLLLAALRSAEIGYWTLLRGIAVAAYAVFWATLVSLRGATSPARDAPVVSFPLVYLTFHYGVGCYWTSGTESPLGLVIAAAHALFVVRPSSRPATVAVALGPLVRHELALPFLAAFAWKWRRERRFPLGMLLLAGVPMAAWMLFRVRQYADLFPSTFYLKDTVDVAQGWAYVVDTAGPYLVAVWAPTLAVLWFVVRGRMGRASLGRERLVQLGLAALVVAYVVKIGGDARHFRYLAFPFVLLCCAGSGVLETAVLRVAPRRGAALAAVVAVAVAALAFSRGPRQLDVHPFRLPPGARLVDKIADAAHHRIHADLPRLSPWESGDAIEMLPRYEELRDRDGEIPIGGVVAHFICWKLYERPDRWATHSLGLTDMILARTVMPADRPSHKNGLKPLARDLALVQHWRGSDPPSPGLHRRAVEAGVAAPWIAANLETIEALERKMYNRHDLLENLKLAFTFPGRIVP